jgi:hypothetical protein
MIHLLMLPMLSVLSSLLGGNQTAGCANLAHYGNLITSVTANEPWYCPINQQITNQWEKYLPALLIVTLISFLLAGIILMVGQALGSARIRGYGAAELYEATATAIIVAGFIYVCAVIFGVGPGALVGAINPYATAFHLMGSTITSAQNIYTSIYRSYVPLSESASVSISVGGPEASLTRTNFATGEVFAGGIGLFANVYTFLISVLYLNPAAALAKIMVEGMAVLYGEYYLLVFFSVAAIPVFLVPGVIFRALLPTRGLGGVMIAIAIGFFLVMPSLFAVVYYFTAQTVITSMNVANSQMQAASYAGGAVTGPQSPLVQDLNNAQSAMSGFWMLVLFYPFMIIAFTYSFIIQFSKLIGGTYQQQAMGRLRGFL